MHGVGFTTFGSLLLPTREDQTYDRRSTSMDATSFVCVGDYFRNETYRAWESTLSTAMCVATLMHAVVYRGRAPPSIGWSFRKQSRADTSTHHIWAPVMYPLSLRTAVDVVHRPPRWLANLLISFLCARPPSSGIYSNHKHQF